MIFARKIDLNRHKFQGFGAFKCSIVYVLVFIRNIVFGSMQIALKSFIFSLAARQFVHVQRARHAMSVARLGLELTDKEAGVQPVGALAAAVGHTVVPV